MRQQFIDKISTTLVPGDVNTNDVESEETQESKSKNEEKTVLEGEVSLLYKINFAFCTFWLFVYECAYISSKIFFFFFGV